RRGKPEAREGRTPAAIRVPKPQVAGPGIIGRCSSPSLSLCSPQFSGCWFGVGSPNSPKDVELMLHLFRLGRVGQKQNEAARVSGPVTCLHRSASTCGTAER